MLATVATVLPGNSENVAQHHRELGHSSFFSLKDEENVSTGSGDKDSTVDSENQAPIQLVESSDYEGVNIYT